MKKRSRACVATFAGTDPSSGAGIQADLKTISATGSYAASIITVLLAQNTQGVQSILEIPSSFIQQQIESVFQDLNITSVKIGMLYNIANIASVYAALKKYQPKHIILDPVMIAKNGCELLKSETISYLKKKLFSLATLITPNLFEAERILNRKIINTSQMEAAAIKMGQDFKTNILLKGGHLESSKSPDVLYHQLKNSCLWFHEERINSRNTHGTGCTLSSAVASYLAQNFPLEDAIFAAKKYLLKAIRSGKNLQIGHGYGPVDHFYFLNY